MERGAGRPGRLNGKRLQRMSGATFLAGRAAMARDRAIVIDRIRCGTLEVTALLDRSEVGLLMDWMGNWGCTPVGMEETRSRLLEWTSTSLAWRRQHIPYAVTCVRPFYIVKAARHGRTDWTTISFLHS